MGDKQQKEGKIRKFIRWVDSAEILGAAWEWAKRWWPMILATASAPITFALAYLDQQPRSVQFVLVVFLFFVVLALCVVIARYWGDAKPKQTTPASNTVDKPEFIAPDGRKFVKDGFTVPEVFRTRGPQEIIGSVVPIGVMALEMGKIEGKVFNKCVISGPAVLFFGKECYVDSECRIERMNMPLEAHFLKLYKSQKSMMGPIKLNNCRFLGCTFQFVGFTGDHDKLDEFRELLKKNSS